MNSTASNGSATVIDNPEPTKKDVNDELTIAIASKHVQPSAMPEDLKMKKRAEAPKLEQMLEETIKVKGESDAIQKNWNTEGELEVEGLSDMTLHSFILQAEALGKKISYTKTLKVKISD